jgi:hypothetical protein
MRPLNSSWKQIRLNSHDQHEKSQVTLNSQLCREPRNGFEIIMRIVQITDYEAKVSPDEL